MSSVQYTSHLHMYIFTNTLNKHFLPSPQTGTDLPIKNFPCFFLYDFLFDVQHVEGHTHSGLVLIWLKYEICTPAVQTGELERRGRL